MRRGLQGVRWEIHAAASAERAGVDEVPGVQEAGAQSSFDIQLARQGIDFGREESRVHGSEARGQRGVRTAVAYVF